MEVEWRWSGGGVDLYSPASWLRPYAVNNPLLPTLGSKPLLRCLAGATARVKLANFQGATIDATTTTIIKRLNSRLFYRPTTEVKKHVFLSVNP